VGQYGRDERGEPADQPGHGGLGAAEQFGHQGLGQVVPQVDQHDQDRTVRADRTASRRIDSAVGIHIGDDAVDLLAAQSGHNLHPRRPVREDRLSSHKPGDLPTIGRCVHHGHVTSRSTCWTNPSTNIE